MQIWRIIILHTEPRMRLIVSKSGYINLQLKPSIFTQCCVVYIQTSFQSMLEYQNFFLRFTLFY